MENIDTVYIVTPPHSSSIIGFFCKKMTKVKLVVDFRDPWANDFDLKAPTFLHCAAHKFAEKKVINICDAIITTTQAHTDYFIKSLVKKELPKVYTITNGVDILSYKPKSTALYNSFTITYTGNFDSTRQPDSLLKQPQRLENILLTFLVQKQLNFLEYIMFFLKKKLKRTA